jgi:hypothetical protein
MYSLAACHKNGLHNIPDIRRWLLRTHGVTPSVPARPISAQIMVVRGVPLSSVVLASTQIKTIGAILLLGVTLCNTMHIWWWCFGKPR